MAVKVSIVIPVYNGATYLRRAIDSAINQSYNGKYEVILLDDGSTDETAAICKEYAEKYSFIRYHYQENQGLTRSRENAIELAKGDYICWIDSDDVVSPDLLKITMNKIEETNADICVFSWQGVWESGKTENHLVEDHPVEEWRKRTLVGEANTVWSYICKRELWLNEKAPWQVERSSEDAYMTPILFEKAQKIVAVPDILYYYRQDNPYSIIHTYSGIKLLGSGYVLYKKFKKCLEKYPDILDRVGNDALRLLSRSYCISAYLEDLDEEKRELVRKYCLFVADHMNHVPFRNKYRVFLIRHRINSIIRLMGKLSFKDRNAKNKKVKKMMNK